MLLTSFFLDKILHLLTHVNEELLDLLPPPTNIVEVLAMIEELLEFLQAAVRHLAFLSYEYGQEISLVFVVVQDHMVHLVHEVDLHWVFDVFVIPNQIHAIEPRRSPPVGSPKSLCVGVLGSFPPKTGDRKCCFHQWDNWVDKSNY